MCIEINKWKNKLVIIIHNLVIEHKNKNKKSTVINQL